MKSTAELTLMQLCQEVDYWKSRVEEAENTSKYWEAKYTELLNRSLLDAKKGVANALAIALHATDDSDGNLVISKEGRKEISKRLKD